MSLGLSAQKGVGCAYQECSLLQNPWCIVGGNPALRLKTQDDLCSGCRMCEVLCALVNYGENNPKKSAIRPRGHFPVPGKYEVVYCDQCGKCAEACPVGAISNENGVFIVNKEECAGCYACVDACPRGAMFVHPEELAPIKCTLCGECAKYCPRNAVFDASLAPKEVANS